MMKTETSIYLYNYDTMNNLELINGLRDFCEQYDCASCAECPIFCSKEDECPLHTVVARLEDTL